MARGPTAQDLLYNPRFTTPDFRRFSDRWVIDSQRARATETAYLDVPYGPDASERLDIFMPRGPSRGLLLFIHGGYWRALDKRDFSFVAPAFTASGVTVAVVNYALAPRVTVRDIVLQVVQACAWLHRNGSHFGAPQDALYVCGHSAGGHLTAMMLACEWPRYAADLPRRVVRGGLAVSGLYDVREIARTPSLNSDLHLTQSSALVVSPAFLPPATDASLSIAVGEIEPAGFHHQHELMRARWRSVLADDLRCPGRHHFDILDDLTAEGRPLFEAVMKMMGHG